MRGDDLRPPHRPPALPPLVADLLLVVAVVGVFTASDPGVNDPGYRKGDVLTWALLVISLVALAFRRWPVPVLCVTGAVCAGWAALQGTLASC
ncbi:hypothetical protein ACPCKW_36235 [Streptomyces griseoincarnatus]